MSIRVALLAVSSLFLTGCLEHGILLNKPPGFAAPVTEFRSAQKDQGPADTEPEPRGVAIAATPSPESTPVPQPTPLAAPTGLPVPSATPVQSIKLSLAPQRYTMSYQGESRDFAVQAVDQNGQTVDPASLNLLWTIERPELFAIQPAGGVCKATSLQTWGFSRLFVEIQGQPDSKVSAAVEIVVSSGGGGGGGGYVPAPEAPVVPAPVAPVPVPVAPVPVVPAGALTAPVIDSSNYAYAGSSDGKLYAFDASGALQWSFTADGAIRRNPAAHAGGASRLYFGTEAGSFYGLSFTQGANANDGTAVWTAAIGAGITTAPLVNEAQNLVVFGDAQGRLHGYGLDGSPRWSNNEMSAQALRSSPVMNSNHHIYAATAEGQVCSFNTDGTSLACETLNDGGLGAAAALNADLVFANRYLLIAASQDGRVYSLELKADGSFWGHSSFNLGSPISNPPAVARSTIYQPIGDKLYAIENNDGMRALAGWPQPVTVCPGSRIVGAPLVTESATGGFVYVSCTDGKLYKLNADNGTILSNQTISGDGTALVDGPASYVPADRASQLRQGGANGTLQSFDANGEILAGINDDTSENWPRLRFDALNSAVFPYGPEADEE